MLQDAAKKTAEAKKVVSSVADLSGLQFLFFLSQLLQSRILFSTEPLSSGLVARLGRLAECLDNCGQENYLSYFIEHRSVFLNFVFNTDSHSVI